MDGMVEGSIVQVIGSTLDAEFPKGQLPDIYDALEVRTGDNGSEIDLTCEVQQHLGDFTHADTPDADQVIIGNFAQDTFLITTNAIRMRIHS